MKAAELIVRCLENEGVQFIFGVPGEENMDVLDALLDSSIRFVMTRHEQGAAFMADVHGRVTGRAGVCLSTLGPGATNLMTGVADANLDRAPLVALTGQVGLDRMHKESHQFVDVVSLFRPITKWNTTLRLPDMIPEAVRKAFKLAQTEKSGATHIEIPEDVARQNVDELPLIAQYPRSGPPSAQQIERAVQIISAARAPVVLAGNGIARGGASEALLDFAQRLNIPVATTFMGKGAISDHHPLSLGAIGLQVHDYANAGFDQADVVIAVGYDFVEYSPRWWNPQRDKTIVHIDMSPAEVDAAFVVAVGVVGNIGESLTEIANRAKPRQSTHVARLGQLLHEEREQYRQDNSFPLKPQRILSDLRGALREEDIVISDVGAHKIWVARMFPCYRPSTCIISNGFASMGIAVPGAVAAKLIFPDRRVVAVCGDGGFLMNAAELETAARLNVPIVVLILSDQTFGLIKWKQLSEYGRSAFVDFNNPDFVRFAESFGAKGYRIQAAEELAPVLNRALESGTSAVIDCPVDFAENMKLTEKLGSLVPGN